MSHEEKGSLYQKKSVSEKEDLRCNLARTIQVDTGPGVVREAWLRRGQACAWLCELGGGDIRHLAGRSEHEFPSPAS